MEEKQNQANDSKVDQIHSERETVECTVRMINAIKKKFFSITNRLKEPRCDWLPSSLIILFAELVLASRVNGFLAFFK